MNTKKSILELHALLNDISVAELTTIVDRNTADLDCRSIQSIMTHVVKAGYGYAISIRRHQGEILEDAVRITLNSVDAYQKALISMFDYNEQLFEDYPNLKLEEYDPSKKMKVSWGQYYDVEQLLEHAIVHILRHRRQIERFLIKLNDGVI